MAQIINFTEYKNSKEEEKKRIKERLALSRKYDTLCGVIHKLQSSIGTTFLTRKIDEYGQVKGEEIIIEDYVMEAIHTALENMLDDVKSEINGMQSFANNGL